RSALGRAIPPPAPVSLRSRCRSSLPLEQNPFRSTFTATSRQRSRFGRSRLSGGMKPPDNLLNVHIIVADCTKSPDITLLHADNTERTLAQSVPNATPRILSATRWRNEGYSRRRFVQAT